MGVHIEILEDHTECVGRIPWVSIILEPDQLRNARNPDWSMIYCRFTWQIALENWWPLEIPSLKLTANALENWWERKRIRLPGRGQGAYFQGRLLWNFLGIDGATWWLVLSLRLFGGKFDPSVKGCQGNGWELMACSFRIREILMNLQQDFHGNTPLHLSVFLFLVLIQLSLVHWKPILKETPGVMTETGRKRNPLSY